MFVTTLSHLCNLNVTKERDFCIVKPSIIKLMKMKFLPAMLSLMVLTAVTVTAQDNDEFKPSGKFFGLLFTNYHTSFSGGENTSAFEVTRSYFGYDYSFSKQFTSRIMYDGTTEVISGKTIYSGYLRNAYLQYDNGKLLMRGGLIGAEQISMMEKIWGFRYITKPTIDYTGMTQSADLGFMTMVRAAKSLNVDLSVTNGRGFKDITSNGTYRLSAGFTLTPADKVIVRGYYDMMGPSGRMQRTASLTAAWLGTKFSAGAEYLRQDNASMTDGRDYSGISIFTRLSVSDRVRLFARYDRISSVTMAGDEDPWNLSKDGSYIFAGIDFSPVRNVRISPNFVGYLPSDGASDNVSTIGLNIEARF
jgi:hypothetical protein